MNILIPKKELVDLYLNQYKSSTEIAQRYGCSRNTVLRNLKRCDILSRKYTNVKRELRKPLGKKLLHQLYVVEGKTSTQIATLTNLHVGSVLNQLRSYGLGSFIKHCGSSGLETKLTKNILFKKYVLDKEVMADIARDFDCALVTIRNYLIRYGLNKYITRNRPKPKIAGEFSPTKRPEVRAKMSRNHADFNGRKNPRFGQPAAHGKRIVYKGIWMRSSWEVLYAQYLDKNKIEWQYEPKAFDLCEATYRPDFYLSEIDQYIEIKGLWRDKAKEKFNLFRKMYPSINIEVLDEKKLIKLGIL